MSLGSVVTLSVSVLRLEIYAFSISFFLVSFSGSLLVKKKKKKPKERALRFIAFPYYFAIFNLINFCSYLHPAIPSACFGFILLSLQVHEVGA